MKNGAEETTNAYGLSHISFFLFRISRYALDILFPPLCAYCEAYLDNETTPFCNACLGMIVRQTSLICPICNARMAANKNICTHGKSKRDQYPYLLGAATHYTDPVVRACIHRCKYEKVHSLAPVFAKLLVEYTNALDPKPSIFASLCIK